MPPCGACAEARRAHDAWQQTDRAPPAGPHDDQQAAARARNAQHMAALAADRDRPVETDGTGPAKARRALRRPGSDP